MTVIRILVVKRILACYTPPWLLYASLVVIRIPGCYTWSLYASLVVIRIPGNNSYKPP